MFVSLPFLHRNFRKIQVVFVSEENGEFLCQVEFPSRPFFYPYDVDLFTSQYPQTIFLLDLTNHFIPEAISVKRIVFQNWWKKNLNCFHTQNTQNSTFPIQSHRFWHIFSLLFSTGPPGTHKKRASSIIFRKKAAANSQKREILSGKKSHKKI